MVVGTPYSLFGVRGATISRMHARMGPGMLGSGDRTGFAAQTGLWLALVVLVGTLLRFAGLGTESIWLDEATSLMIARMDLTSVVAWAAADIHPPLYYLTLHFWLVCGDSEFAIRALSAVLGVLTIVILYALARELFDPEVGLLSALLLALSPMHIWYSQEARMYAMVAAWSLLASYFLVLALRRQRARYWLGYVVASALALYTHYFELFVLLFQNLFVLFWLWHNKTGHRDTSQGHNEQWRRKPWLSWVTSELAIALLFLPWVPVVYRQVSGGGGGWVEKAVGRPSLRALVDTWLHFSIGLERQFYPAALRRMALVLFAVCILAALTTLLPRFRRKPTAWSRASLLFCIMYVVVPLLTAWLISQVKPMYTHRYLLPFVPPYCIIVACGLKAIGTPYSLFGVKWNWARAAILLFLTLALLVGNWNAWRIGQKDDWRWASSYVLAHAQPGDVVLFLPRWTAKPFDYYARGQVVTSMDLPVPVTDQAAANVAADIARQFKRVWLIWQRGHYSDPGGTVKEIFDSRFTLIETAEFRTMETLMLYDLTTTEGSD
jgi:mannosyltransferase